MKKSAFQRSFRAIDSMTSAQRHESFGCDRASEQERLGGRGRLVGGNPHRASGAGGMPTHLQCVDEDSSCRSSPQGPLDVFPGEIQRRGVGPEGGLEVREQHESRLFVEAPISGLARLFEGSEGKRHRRKRRDLVSEILQGATGRNSETGPKTGRRAARRGLFREQVPVLVVRDRSGATSDAIPKDNHREIEAVLGPLLARDAVLCSDGGGKGPIAVATRKRSVAHRAVNLSAMGVRVFAGALPHPAASAYHSRLKDWMRRFHGVSTKYLDHYLGWRRMIEAFGEHLNSTLWLTLSIGRHELQHDLET